MRSCVLTCPRACAQKDGASSSDGGAGAATFFANPMFAPQVTTGRPAWYLGDVARAEAEAELPAGTPGAFVVRDVRETHGQELLLRLASGSIEAHPIKKAARGRILLDGRGVGGGGCGWGRGRGEGAGVVCSGCPNDQSARRESHCWGEQFGPADPAPSDGPRDAVTRGSCCS